MACICIIDAMAVVSDFLAGTERGKLGSDGCSGTTSSHRGRFYPSDTRDPDERLERR